MHFAYTRAVSNLSIFGRLIQLFTKKENQSMSQTPSHFVLIFFNKLVLESRGGGVTLNYLPVFLKKNIIVRSFVRSDIPQNRDQAFTPALDTYYGQKYDYVAIFWFTLFILRNKIFKKELPDMTKWQKRSRFYCSELFEFSGIKDYNHLDPNSQMLAVSEDQRFTRLL